MGVKLIRITTVPISLRVLLKGQHKFMRSQGFDVLGVSSSGPDLEEVHATEGIPVAALEMTRTISPLKDLVSLWRFYRLCQKEKPVIVHSHTPKAGLIGMLGAMLAGVPLRLHTVAGLPLMETSGLKRRILEWVEKIIYFSATKVYPNSRGLYNFILQHNYTTPQKMKVIANGSSNGIDTTYFSRLALANASIDQLKANLGIQKEDFVFVFVGRLVGDKGINELVAAFNRLDNPRVKLLLVGPLESELDPLHPQTLALIQQHPNILSVGFQKDVRPYFAISHALAFPSYREGFPNVVMQAGAMELPCIVSNINGCNEIVVEGENGLIVPTKDEEALCQAMCRLINEEGLYNKMKSKARNMITSRYEQKVVWEALLEEYRKLLKEKRLGDV